MDAALDIFRALADHSRLRIVCLLRTMELSVGELAQVLGQSQPRVSRHVKILTDAGLAERRKEGSWVFVALGEEARVAPVLAALDAWEAGTSDRQTSADAARLAASLGYALSLGLWLIAPKPVQFYYHYFAPSLFLLAALAEDIAELHARGVDVLVVSSGSIALGRTVLGLAPGALKLDGAVLANIFLGKIKTWNDPAIAKENEGVDLPDTKITPVNRSDESGTTANFQDYLKEAAGDAWPHEPSKEFPGDGEGAAKTSGVVNVVSSTEYTIGYADASAIGGLNSVKVGVGEEFVGYSPEAAAKLVETSEEKEDGSLEIDRATTEQGVYPVVLVSYHIYCNQYESQETVDQVKAFAEYVVSEDGQKTAEESAGNAPISEDTRKKAMERIEAISVKG